MSECNIEAADPDNGTYFGMPCRPESAALVLVSAPWDATAPEGSSSSYAPDAMIEESMRQYRKLAVVVLLIFSAVITPPDVVSQILIFVPCYALYEYGIRIARRIEIQREKAEAEYMARMEAEGSAVKPTETEDTAQDDTVSALDRESESDEKPETDDAEK